MLILTFAFFALGFSLARFGVLAALVATALSTPAWLIYDLMRGGTLAQAVLWSAFFAFVQRAGYLVGRYYGRPVFLEREPPASVFGTILIAIFLLLNELERAGNPGSRGVSKPGGQSNRRESLRSSEAEDDAAGTMPRRAAF